MLKKLLPVLLIFCSPGLYAVNYVSAASGAWNTATTWTPNGIPTAADNVTVGTGHTITMNTPNPVCLGLTVTGTLNWSVTSVASVSGNLTLNPGSIVGGSVTGTLNVAGNLIVVAGGTSTIGRVNLAITGSTTINGTVLFNNGTGTKSFTGDVTIASGGVWTSNATVTYTMSADLNMDGGTINGTASGRFSPVNLNINSGTNTIGNSTFNRTGGSNFNINSTVTFNNTGGTKDWLDVNINAAGTWTNSSPEGFNVRGNFVNDGTFTSGTGPFVFMSAAGTLSGANTITISGTVTINGAYTNNGTFSIAGTTFSGTGSLTQGTNASLFIRPTIISITTLNCSASGNTVTYNHASTAQNIEMPADGSYFNLTVTGASVKTLPGDMTIDGSVTIAGGATLDVDAIGNYLIFLAGDWNNTGGTFLPQAGLVVFNGASQTITNGTTENFYDLEINSNVILACNLNIDNDLNNNGTLDVTASNFQINLAHDFNNFGTFLQNQGTIVLDGTTGQTVTGGAPYNLYNITLNNISGVIQNIDLNIEGVLTPTVGTWDVNLFNVVLLSNASGTAAIGEIGPTGDFLGNVTMQRFITGATDWRFLASPVLGSTLADWQDDFITSGYTGSTYPTFSFVSVYTYDETVAGDKDQGYTAPGGSGDATTPGLGFWVYMGPNPVTVDVTGQPFKGVQNFNITHTANFGNLDDGWNMVANPYPCPIDWDAPGWTMGTGINGQIQIWNAAAQQYATYILGSGGVGTNGGSNIITSSQAFWVKADDVGTYTLTSDETVKAPGTDPYIRAQSSNSFASSNQYGFKLKVTGNSYSDETIIRFDPSATNNFDPSLDGNKFWSFNPSVPGIATVMSSIEYAINTLPTLTANISIPVFVKVGVTGNYTISVNDFISTFPGSSCLVLEDLVTGTQTNLRNASYTCNISSSTSTPRFVIHVGQPVSSSLTDVTCNGAGNGSITANGIGTPPWTYVWLDSNNNVIQTNSNISTSSTLSNLASGIYYVEVTAGSSVCGTVRDTFVIAEPLALNAVTSTTDPTCNGSTNGSATASPTGGTAPYTYLWSNGNTNATASGLAAGTYTVTVTDANGCTGTSLVTLTQPGPMTANFTVSSSTLNLYWNNTVQFTNTSTGATSYSWDFGDGSLPDPSANPSHSYASLGAFNVVLSATTGTCTTTSTRVINVVYDPLSIQESGSSDGISLVNDNGQLIINFSLGAASDALISVLDINGKKIFADKHLRVESNSITFDMKDKATGIYLVRIQLDDKTITRKVQF